METSEKWEGDQKLFQEPWEDFKWKNHVGHYKAHIPLYLGIE